MDNLLTHTSSPVYLSKQTLLDVVMRSKNKDAAILNPHEYATHAVRIMKGKLAELIVSGISYEKIDEWYEMTQFKVYYAGESQDQ